MVNGSRRLALPLLRPHREGRRLSWRLVESFLKGSKSSAPSDTHSSGGRTSSCHAATHRGPPQKQRVEWEPWRGGEWCSWRRRPAWDVPYTHLLLGLPEGEASKASGAVPEGGGPKGKAGAPPVRTENVVTIPNFLCVVRMCMAPPLAYLVLQAQFGPAIALLTVAALTDLADGWIARWIPGQASVMGSFLDPMADKVLVGTLVVALTYVHLLPVPLTALILSRDAVLIGAAFWIRYRSLPPPPTLRTYFDVTSPTARLAPTLISKVNTGVQLSLVALTLLSTLCPLPPHTLTLLWYATAGTTLLSALSYAFAKDTYAVLTHPPKHT